MKRVDHLLLYHEWLYAGHVSKRCGIVGGQGLALADEGLQLVQLAQAKSTLEVCKAIIVTQIDHLVDKVPSLRPLTMVASDAMVTKDAHALRQRCTVRGDRPPFTCGDVLDWMKAKGIEVGQRPHRATVITPTDSMAGI